MTFKRTKINDHLETLIECNDKSQCKFDSLMAEGEEVLTEWTDMVDFIEYLQSYVRGHLITGAEYELKSLFLHLEKHNGIVCLFIHYKHEEYFYTKLEASQIAHKLNRVLGRCDLFCKL